MKKNHLIREEIKKLSEENEKMLKSKKINPKILKNTENSMTFLVEEDLGEPRGKLEMEDVKQYFEMLSNNNPIYHTSENMSEKLYTNNHSVIMGYFEAYEKHCPMTITPDIIWLLISQGFTHHILHNFEELRYEFVDFYGKKELIVKNNFSDIESVDSKSWNEFFEEIVNQIAKYTGEEIINILSPNFSTTDKITLQVGNITIMGAMEKYFIYIIELMGCGISKINLEGTLEDWEKILEKTNKLRKYELDWWIDEIEPIIKKIIST